MTSTTSSFRIEPARTDEDLAGISKLAGEIWRSCYREMISLEQIDYMLARMYSLDVMREELHHRGVCYDMLYEANELIGYAGYGPTEDPADLMLHKLYIRADRQRGGFGSALLQHVEEIAAQTGYRRIVLRVNRNNDRAIGAYRRNGFVVLREDIADIGGGFVMDDYLMAKELDV